MLVKVNECRKCPAFYANYDSMIGYCKFTKDTLFHDDRSLMNLDTSKIYHTCPLLDSDIIVTLER